MSVLCSVQKLRSRGWSLVGLCRICVGASTRHSCEFLGPFLLEIVRLVVKGEAVMECGHLTELHELIMQLA